MPATMIRLVLCLLALALPSRLTGQGSEPLRKTDLIRLLSTALISRGEIAGLIRRNCLAFRPTERDWADLRDLGADADVMSSVGGCTARTSTPRGGAAPRGPAPELLPVSAALEAVPLASRVTAAAGSDVVIRVQARRGETPEPGVRLALRGGSGIPGAPARNPEAVTTDSGLAVFHVAAGPRVQTYRLEVLTGGGAVLPGRPTIALAVVAAAPAGADIQPQRLDLGREEGAVTVQVDVRDAFGNPVPDEPVELQPQSAQMGLPPDTRSTDSLGRTAFTIQASAVRHPGRIAVRVRGQALGLVEAFLAGPVSSARSGFLAGSEQRGVAGTSLPAPLLFEARSPSGRPLPGRLVAFQAQNARIAPDSAVTDSMGQAKVDVTLGTRAGSAVITATVEAIQLPETVLVLPGVPVELWLERAGTRVDRGRIAVQLGVPFALTLRARDEYGNLVPTAPLSRTLQDARRAFNTPWQLVKLVSVQSDSLATVLTFKPIALGTTDLTIVAGLRASVSVDVVRSGH